MHFDLVDLRLLSAIAATGSLSKAAATFPVAVSAASTRLRVFEQRCGLVLFTRTADGMQATPAGRLIIEHARTVLGAAEKLDSTLAELSGHRRITLRLSATTVAHSTFLPPALGLFLADYPEADLQLIEQKSTEILQSIRTGEIDLGVYDGNLPTGELLSLPFHDDRLVLLVPQGHALSLCPAVHLRQALDFPFVCLPPERSMQRFIEDMAVRNAVPLKVRVRAPSFGAVAQLVAQNAGVAMLPEVAAARFVLELPVAIVRLEDAWAVRELRICIKSWQTLSSHARQLVAYLSPAAIVA